MTTSIVLEYTRTCLVSNHAKKGNTRHSRRYSSTYSTRILTLRVFASTSLQNTRKYSFLQVLILVLLLARAKNNAPIATQAMAWGAWSWHYTSGGEVVGGEEVSVQVEMKKNIPTAVNLARQCQIYFPHLKSASARQGNPLLNVCESSGSVPRRPTSFRLHFIPSPLLQPEWPSNGLAAHFPGETASRRVTDKSWATQEVVSITALTKVARRIALSSFAALTRVARRVVASRWLERINAATLVGLHDVYSAGRDC